MIRKLGFALLLSLLVNALLAGWLVAQYMSDVYFRIYVDQFLGFNSTFVILAIGVGGGSTLGYLFLRRKGHVDYSSLSGLGKAKGLKINEGFHSPPSASQVKVLPAGAPPMQPSKHTAYAVPPVSRGSSQSSSSFQKGIPGEAWSSASRQATAPPGPSSFAPQFAKPQSPSTAPIQRADQFSPVREQLDTRQGRETGSSRWATEPRPMSERSEPVFSPAKPTSEGFSGVEMGLKRVPIQGMGPAPPQPSSQPQAQPQISTSNWKSTDSGVRADLQAPASQWVSPVPRQPYNPSPRAAPAGSALPGQRPQPPSGLPVRPGQAPPPRPSFPPRQGPPRPLAYPGAPRPMQPRQGSPGAFRPGLVVTGPQGAAPRSVNAGEIPGQRFPLPSNLSQSPDVKSSSPMSSGRSSQGEVTGLGQPSGQGGIAQGAKAGQASGSSDEKPSSDQSSGVEMDWDTALDTILKTLRKDKVGEK